jgi:hypothetical protein
MNKNIIIALLIVTFAQVLTYYQMQGQFFNEWFRKNTGIVILLGIPVSWLFIKYAQFAYEGFGGATWPGRLISFAVGAIVFTILSWQVMGEQVNGKTLLCLILAMGILAIQILWK